MYLYLLFWQERTRVGYTHPPLLFGPLVSLPISIYMNLWLIFEIEKHVKREGCDNDLYQPFVISLRVYERMYVVEVGGVL